MSELDPLPISLIAHTAFCPRRAWLEAAGEQVDSFAIEEGKHAHRNIDAAKNSRPAAQRSVDVSHTKLNIVGRCDVVEHADDGLTVVEYKSSPIRRKWQPTQAMRVQLALQGLCLKDAGRHVCGYRVFFPNSARSVNVDIGAKDEREAIELVTTTREVVTSPTAPLPLVDDPRCNGCSHVAICLPDERNSKPVRKQIRASDPSGETLHLNTPGARASLRRGRVLVSKAGEELASLPVNRIQGVVVHGNVDLSGALTREFLWRSIPVVWCSGRGRVVGFARSASSPNGLARSRQCRGEPGLSAHFARGFLSAKVANQATILRRLGQGGNSSLVSSLRLEQNRLSSALSVPEAVGIEGVCAKLYFGSFPMVLKRHGGYFQSRWPGRTGRGARDPLNSALNYAYGLLLSEVVRACLSCGLDPHIGFVHSSNRNKPALALDLMEEFRPVVADSVVVGAINNGELLPSHFSQTFGDSRILLPGRKALISAFERRVATVFTHPVYRYKVSWRRAIEVQARMVLGVIDGTQPSYEGIRVR